MTTLQRYLYRKCVRSDFQSDISIAAIDAMEEYNLSYYDTVYLKLAAGRKRERIFHELVRDGCLPTWYTYNAAVYFHAGVQWRQPGRPENQSKIKKINDRNPPLTHVLILNNKEKTFKNSITEGIVPDGFDASKIPYSNPMNFYEKNKKWLSSTGYPEPKVLEITNKRTPEVTVHEVTDNEEDDDEIEFLEMIDNNNDEGFEPVFDVEMDEQDGDHPEEYMTVITPEGREEILDLFDYIPGGYIDGIVDFMERARILKSLPKMEPKTESNNNENPLLNKGGFIEKMAERILKPQPEKKTEKKLESNNNDDNPLAMFDSEDYAFNFANPPRPAELQPIPSSETLREVTTADFLPKEDKEKFLSNNKQFKDMCLKVFQRDQKIMRENEARKWKPE